MPMWGQAEERRESATTLFSLVFFLMKLLQMRLVLLVVLTFILSALKIEDFQVLIPFSWAGYGRVLTGTSHF